MYCVTYGVTASSHWKAANLREGQFATGSMAAGARAKPACVWTRVSPPQSLQLSSSPHHCLLHACTGRTQASLPSPSRPQRMHLGRLGPATLPSSASSTAQCSSRSKNTRCTAPLNQNFARRAPEARSSTRTRTAGAPRAYAAHNSASGCSVKCSCTPLNHRARSGARQQLSRGPQKAHTRGQLTPLEQPARPATQFRRRAVSSCGCSVGKKAAARGTTTSTRLRPMYRRHGNRSANRPEAAPPARHVPRHERHGAHCPSRSSCWSWAATAAHSVLLQRCSAAAPQHYA